MSTIVIKGGTAVLESELLDNALIIVENDRIAFLGSKTSPFIPSDAEVIEANGLWVCPGFVDVHVHGAGGDRLGADRDANIRIARTLARFGTTSFLAGIGTSSETTTFDAVTVISQLMEEGSGGAEILGIHLEGPYLSLQKKGGMDANYLRLPSVTELNQLIAASGNHIRLVGIAPELKGAIEAITYLRDRGIVVSVAHSNATYEEACAGIWAGITHATHTYNAMTGLHHREPGVLGAILGNDAVTAELIGDLVHVVPAAVLVLLRCKGPDRVTLVTDGVFATGLPDGEYDHGDGRNVIVKNGVCELPDGTLAGSISTMNRNVANLVQKLHVDLAIAVRMASLNPAREIGISNHKGSLKPGKDADLTLLDRDFQVQRTFVRGSEVYRRQN